MKHMVLIDSVYSYPYATEPHIDPIPDTAMDGVRNRVYVWLCGGVGHKYQFHEAKTK